MNTYHPDPAINALVTEEANDAERANLAAGFPPSWWLCPDCGAKHNRGHFGNIGNHRCLNCGYVGGGGVMADSKEALEWTPLPPPPKGAN